MIHFHSKRLLKIMKFWAKIFIERSNIHCNRINHRLLRCEDGKIVSVCVCVCKRSWESLRGIEENEKVKDREREGSPSIVQVCEFIFGKMNRNGIFFNRHSWLSTISFILCQRSLSTVRLSMFMFFANGASN